MSVYTALSFDVVFLTPHLILEFKETSMFPDFQDIPKTCVFIETFWT